MRRRRVWIWMICTACLLAAGSPAPGADWPMWRYDAARTAASPEQLPQQLSLRWTRRFAPREQVWDDPLNHDLMPYDRVLEPVVLGERMFVGFNDRDKVVALDARTGRQLWEFFADGPVRLPVAGWRDRVFFASDDGYLYCVSAESGQLIWRFRGGPSPRKLIGNRRVISSWPARGGPVVRDDKVYFAASIWPFMGTFIYALDAASGQIMWVNDRTGAQYHKQPHSAPGFAGVAPQGALAATSQMLLVPGGRSVPAALDRQTGQLRYFEINAGGKGNGGSLVMANEAEFFVHTRERGVRAFQLGTGAKTDFTCNEPVLAGDRIYAAESPAGRPLVRAYDAASKDRLWEVEADGSGDLILVGDRLYAAGQEQLVAIQLPGAAAHESPRIVWSRPIDGPVARLLAAHRMLYAVTLDGRILGYSEQSAPPIELAETVQALDPPQRVLDRARRLVEAGPAEGYALWYGVADESLLDAVLQMSDLHLVVVDDDAALVDRLRRRYDAAGLYGKRVAVHHGDPRSFQAPPYIANLVFVGGGLAAEVAAQREAMQAIYESVRPYGGVLQLLLPGGEAAEVIQALGQLALSQAEIETLADSVVVRRTGPLPDTADWTHQYGDIANTVKSKDARVKLPLGVLWFGGTSNMDVLPRHGHGPPEQVIGGRLFIQGINSLSARDVYTGRLLWNREFEDLETYDVYFDETYRDTPLDPAYNQVHIPGANARGTNFVATEDRVYILEGSVCHVLDPASGKLVQDFRLPQAPQSGKSQEWGFIGVYKNVLLGGVGFANYRERYNLSFADVDSQLRRNAAGFGSKSLDRSASAALVALDRHTGQPLWQVDARHSFLHNGVVAGGGRVYCLDKNPQPIEDRLRRRGEAAPNTSRIVALDYRTGETQWEVEEDIFGTWLSYAEEFNVLLQAGAAASDRLRSEVGQGMAVYDAADGARKWYQPQLQYSGPCILHHDTIITNANSYRPSAGAFHLSDGSPVMITNPLTGRQQPWLLQRAYGCNSIIASEHLLTFRSGAAGFYDLDSLGGTGNLGGFRSGCTSNLIAANGVLNAPDYTRTCSCPYQNQTSLALVHDPAIEIWTINHAARLHEPGQRFEQIGINFGAPGDRRAEDGLLWIEYPQEGGEPVPMEITVQGDVQYPRRHSSALTGAADPWIVASGIEGATLIRISLQAANADRIQQPSAVQSPPGAHTVRLYFGVLENEQAGERVFDVLLQGEPVLTRFDLAAETVGQRRQVVKEFRDVLIADQLEITFRPIAGRPLLSGVEIRRHAPPAE